MSFRRLPPLFYLGLFPLVCLLWLWADSMVNMMGWSYGRRWDEKLGVGVNRGEVYYGRVMATELKPGRLADYGPDGPLRMTGPYGQCYRMPFPDGGGKMPWFPQPKIGTTDPWCSGDPAFSFVTHYVDLPFWLLLLGYLPPWLGVAWWQAKRRRKKHEQTLPPGA